MRLFSFIFAGLAAVLLSAPYAAAAAEPARPGDAGGVIAETGGSVRLELSLSRPVPWRVWLEDGPPSLIVELTDFEWSELPDVKTTSIAEVSARQTSARTSEMRALLYEPLSLVSAEMSVPEDGQAVLVIELQPSTADAFRAEIAVDDKADGAATGHLVVAIDPGHGGIDPGAEAGDLREADLVLGFAERLKAVLDATGRFDTVLTRTEDVTVSLDQRLSIARAAGADVMISLHADALEGEVDAAGLVVYRLEDTAGSAADRRLVERHGPADRLTGVDLGQAGDDVALALLEMARRETRTRNIALSSAILGGFRSSELVVNTRPERAGPFAVLKAADIPSVLIELGFLSTEADLERLTSEAWQAAAAAALRDGLLLWAAEDALR